MIDDVGLVNLNGRVYDPQLGRFMSADPYVQDATDSQSLNRYAYVRNNPLSYTDPTGFSWFGELIGYLFHGPLNHPFVKDFVRGSSAAQFVIQAAVVFCPGYSKIACAAGSSAYITGVNGGSYGDQIKSAATAAATAYAFMAIGNATNGHYGYDSAAGVDGKGTWGFGAFKVVYSADEYIGTMDFLPTSPDMRQSVAPLLPQAEGIVNPVPSLARQAQRQHQSWSRRASWRAGSIRRYR